MPSLVCAGVHIAACGPTEGWKTRALRRRVIGVLFVVNTAMGALVWICVGRAHRLLGIVRSPIRCLLVRFIVTEVAGADRWMGAERRHAHLLDTYNTWTCILRPA